jgi:hypothetical protein
MGKMSHSPFGQWVALTQLAARLTAETVGVPGGGAAIELVFALAGISDAQADLLRSIKTDTELLRREPFRTVRVFSMNISDTVLLAFDLLVCSTCSPTGSATRANLRVDTPASIRSITARANGSRAAKYS